MTKWNRCHSRINTTPFKGHLNMTTSNSLQLLLLSVNLCIITLILLKVKRNCNPGVNGPSVAVTHDKRANGALSQCFDNRPPWNPFSLQQLRDFFQVPLPYPNTSHKTHGLPLTRSIPKKKKNVWIFASRYDSWLFFFTWRETPRSRRASCCCWWCEFQTSSFWVILWKFLLYSFCNFCKFKTFCFLKPPGITSAIF